MSQKCEICRLPKADVKPRRQRTDDREVLMYACDDCFKSILDKLKKGR